MIILLLVIASCDNEKSWVEQGRINPNDCNEFIVNDSISIKPYILGSYSVFVNGSVDKDVVSTYKATNKDDIEMINTLEFRYKHKSSFIEIDYSIGRNTNCIELN